MGGEMNQKCHYEWMKPFKELVAHCERMTFLLFFFLNKLSLLLQTRRGQ